MNNIAELKERLGAAIAHICRKCKKVCNEYYSGLTPCDTCCWHDDAESEYETPKTEKTPVEKLADILGVGVGELFNIRLSDGKLSGCGPFRLMANGRLYSADDYVAESWLSDILIGAATIEKIPQPEKPEDWKLKMGEIYYFINFGGFVKYEPWMGHDMDLARYAMGNCFPTEEAAEAKKPEMMAKFEAIRREIEG